MRVRFRGFWLPKSGNSAEEYEDAFWPRQDVDREARIFRAAVADGATEASFSRDWADLLAAAYGRGRIGRRLAASLPVLQRQWTERVGSRPLPWYAEEKLRSGAFASLCGLTLRVGRDGNLRWNALAVGDSCVFHLRNNRLCAAFPLDRADQFDNRPHLIGSVPASNGGLASQVRFASGPVHADDRFYLMTDALAAWFLGAIEAGEAVICNLSRVIEAGPDAFGAWAMDLRATGGLRNDDITLLVISVNPQD